MMKTFLHQMNDTCNCFKERRRNAEDGMVYNGNYIPKRFEKAVLRHLILNYSKNFNTFSPPLMLAIQGPKGEGKTFMIENICLYHGIRYIPISGAELCGSWEGDSVTKIISEYEKACIQAAQDRKFSCIVIEDFHKSLAAINAENISRTSNSETLVGRLMNLCDNPYIRGNRIPVILTGNSFTSVYAPLMRNGRMEIFDWVPTLEEKKLIVYYMFRHFYPNIFQYDTDGLVMEFSTYYIAFFKSVIQDLFWKDCDAMVDEFIQNSNMLNLDNITDIVERGIDRNPDLNLQTLIAVARERSNNIPRDFDR